MTLQPVAEDPEEEQSEETCSRRALDRFPDPLPKKSVRDLFLELMCLFDLRLLSWENMKKDAPAGMGST